MSDGIDPKSFSSIPAVLSSIAFYTLHRSGKATELYNSFFDYLKIHEQISVVCLFFSVMYYAVSVSSFVDDDVLKGGHDHDHDDAPQQYPFTKIRNADDLHGKMEAMYTHLLKEQIVHDTADNLIYQDSSTVCAAMVSKRVESVMDTMVQRCKLSCGMWIDSFHRILVGREPDRYEEAINYVLGWCVEFFYSSLTVDQTDDGLLQSFVFRLFELHFHEEMYHERLVDIFQDVAYRTRLGHVLESLLTKHTSEQSADGAFDFSKFTMERYSHVVKHTHTLCAIYLPVVSSLSTVGVTDEAVHGKVETFCDFIGEYVQAKKDYIRCFGSSESEKEGSDINDGRCTWLIVKALQRCDSTQRAILEQNYGTSNKTKETTVQSVYTELKLKSVLEDYRQQNLIHVQTFITDTFSSERNVKEVMEHLLASTHVELNL